MNNGTNTLIQLGSIITPDGLDNTQGYRVYSINGVGLSIRADGGGLDKGVGLVMIIRKK